MSSSKDDGVRSKQNASAPAPPPSVSSRVRLEVDILDADGAAAAQPLLAADERARRSVLVVAGEVDVRQYVRECLREQTDLRVIEAATVSSAVALAAEDPPDLIVAAEQEREVTRILSRIRGIVIVDDAPAGGTALGARVRLLARPFTAEGLVAEVSRLLW